MRKFTLLCLSLITASALWAQTVVDNPLKTIYKSFSVIGDSYSTFYGYTDPEANFQWYPHLGVTQLSQTWWKLLEAETGMKLEQNNSSSGTCICNTSWGGNIDTQNSFVGRCINLREAGLIIVEGATNDNNAGSPLGSYVYNNWSAADLRTFRGGTAYVLSYLKNKYPKSQVVFMLNNGLRDDINTSVETICRHYDVPLFKINGIGKEDEHPTLEGMIQIKNQFVEFLNNLNGWTTRTRGFSYTIPAEDTQADLCLRLPLKKDSWQALCLPFDMDATMIGAAFGKKTDVAAFDAVENSVIRFVLSNEVKAGVPFLIKPSAEVNAPIYIKNAVLSATKALSLDAGGYSFTGTFRRVAVTSKDATKLLLDGDATLYRQPQGSVNMLSFDAYFKRPADAPASIEIVGTDTRQPQTPDMALFSPTRHIEFHAPSAPLLAVDPFLSVWSGSGDLNDNCTRHWSGNDKSITGFVRVDGQLYRFLGNATTELDMTNVILPSALWTTASTYTVPCMVFKKTTPGTTDQVLGVPPTDSRGLDWFDPDYELTDGMETWAEHTSPFGTDANVNGYPSFQWTTDGVSADIYFRRTFTIDGNLDKTVYLACGHDDSPSELYINGTLIKIPHNHADGWFNQEMYRLSDAERALIKTDGTPNVIAVHVHNNYGGAFADCGLYGTREFGDNIFAAADGDAYADRDNMLLAEQQSVDVLPAQTYYTFKADPVDLSLVFSSPQIATDPAMMSVPLNFVSYSVKSNDAAEHDVKVYISTTPQFASGSTTETVNTTCIRRNGLLFGKSGTTSQNMSSGYAPNWGYAYITADPKLGQTINVTESQQMVFAHDMGHTAAGAGYMMIGYDDAQRSVNMNGYTYPAYWTRLYGDITDAFAAYAASYNDIMQRIREFDKTVIDDAEKAGGRQYAELCALAYRQIVAGSKLASNNDGRLLMYNIDNTVTDQISSADICYAAAPLFISYNPQLAAAMVDAVRDYIKVTHFKSEFGNAPHHLGVYPMIGGIGLDNGADTSSSLILVAGAAAKAAGDAGLIDEEMYRQIKDWADFCDLFTLPQYAPNFPNEGSCDNYAGTIVHDNANVRAKCALAMAAVSEVAKMKGNTADADKYMAMARRWVADWNTRYSKDLCYPQGSDVMWGQKYNLYYDRMLETNLFADVISTETGYYLNNCMQPYGLPMDARWDNVAKLHETFMTAAMTSSAEDFSNMIAPCYNYVNTTTASQPLTDIYNCTDGTPIAGVARPTAGMFWAKVLLDKLKSGPITDIDGMTTDKTRSSDRIYNISGQYVGNTSVGLAPGIYISDGRKVVVK